MDPELEETAASVTRLIMIKALRQLARELVAADDREWVALADLKLATARDPQFARGLHEDIWRDVFVADEWACVGRRAGDGSPLYMRRTP